MATILQKSNQILTEKNNKIKPENIKEGVTVYGITGTLKTSEDLDEVLTSQQTLINNQATTIDELNTLLENKAMGFSQESVDLIADILGEEE